MENVLICSDCLRNQGLKLDALKIGIDNPIQCPNCKSINGKKLTKELVRELCYRFFVRGTISRCGYGGYPLIQFNEKHYKNSDIKTPLFLENDIKLIEEVGEIGLFYYGPRFWMFGEIEPLKSLQKKEEKDEIIERVLNEYPIRKLEKGEYFYRLRNNPKEPENYKEYDAPAKCKEMGRFNSEKFPVLYGSQDLEVCIHECRVTVEDKVFIAKLVPKKALKFLDLTELLHEENVTEFESLDIAIHFLFLAGKMSYPICREIAKKAFYKGFDGLIYPSYFSYLRTGAIPFDTVYGISIRRINELKKYAKEQIIPNLALFGRPIEDLAIDVECINKLVINKVSYETSFGPVCKNP